MPSVAIVGTRGYPSYYGGFETAVRKLAPYFVRHGWDVTVYGRPGQVVDDDTERDHRVTSVITHGINSRSLSTLSFGASATKHVLRNKPDVALVMNVANGYFLPFFRALKIPTLVNVDGIEWDRDKWGRAAKTTFKVGARLTARFADELVMDSKAIDARWRADFGRGGLFLPYGGDSRKSTTPPMQLPRRGYALMVARFVPENSVTEFFAAVPRIAQHAPVIIVGSEGYDGPFDTKARQLDSAYENVHWLGHVRDDALLGALWQNCGAYFHGHTVGGTNPALVQAMMVGAPIVARDTVYNREVIEDPTQLTGKNPAEIAASVLSLLRDPLLQERASQRNRIRAEEKYSWESICRGYESALRRLAEQRSAGADT